MEAGIITAGKQWRTLLLTATVLTGFICRAAIYVSPAGNDTWSGHRAEGQGPDGPVATLRAAFDRVQREPADDRRIVVADGLYAMRAALELTAADSGTAASPIVVMAAPGARPVFSGGLHLPPMQPAGDGIWRLRVPDAVSFQQLYIGGHAATRARSPNVGQEAQMAEVEEHKMEEAVEDLKAGTYQLVSLQNGGKLVPADPIGIWLTAYHKWDMTKRRILGQEDDALLIGPGAMKSWNPLHKGTRCYLENHRSFLDAPGEWYLGDDHVLLYVPQPDDKPDAAVIVPRLERLLVIKGASAVPVHHIRFEGLTFAHTGYLWPPEGFSPAQAASPIGAAVEVDYASDIVFADCEIREVGTYGLWLREGVTDSTVRHCRFTQLGAGGVRLGTTGRAREATGNNRVIDSTIRTTGLLFPPAVGILVGNSGNNEVAHNEISDLTYSGISVGWVWGYKDSAARGNRIINNHIHHISGMLSDLGGIYTLGPSPDTVLAGNVIHDISSFSYGGWGLYNDEGSTGILMENNLVYNTKTGGYHQHYGKDNIIRNNIFYNALEQQLQFTRPEEHRSFSFEHNIVLYDKGVLLRGPWEKGKIDMTGNCYWNTAGPVTFSNGDLAAWQAIGRDAGSIVADPGLKSPQTGDFTLAEDSPAKGIGFVPFDWSTAGPRQ